MPDEPPDTKVIISVRTGGRRLFLETTTDLERQGDVLHGLLKVVSTWDAPPKREEEERKPKKELKKMNFATALEGMTLENMEIATVSKNDFDIQRKLNREEKEYFNNLSTEERSQMVKTHQFIINNTDSESTPARFRVLSSKLPDEIKKRIILRFDKMNESVAGDPLKYLQWVDTMLSVPLGKILVPVGDSKIAFTLKEAQSRLDLTVYGHKRAKNAIIQKIYSWLRNPSLPIRPLALYGAPGNGKTTLMKDGLSSIMNRPFSFISLGGATDSSYLLGHGYTYEGSQPGKIVECLISAKTMNPIIYFDELCKVSDTPKGEEIINTLVHLTDVSQMDQFRDRYIQSLPLDLSQILYVFSFNDRRKVNPVLLDRLQLVETDDFTKDDQKTIISKYLYPAILREANINNDDVYLVEEAVDTLLLNIDASKGVRPIRAILEQIVSKVMMYCETLNEALMFPIQGNDLFIESLYEPLDQIRHIQESGLTRPFVNLVGRIGIRSAAINKMIDCKAGRPWESMFC